MFNFLNIFLIFETIVRKFSRCLLDLLFRLFLFRWLFLNNYFFLSNFNFFWTPSLFGLRLLFWLGFLWWLFFNNFLRKRLFDFFGNWSFFWFRFLLWWWSSFFSYNFSLFNLFFRSYNLIFWLLLWRRYSLNWGFLWSYFRTWFSWQNRTLRLFSYGFFNLLALGFLWWRLFSFDNLLCFFANRINRSFA